MTVWSEEREALLKKLYGEGLSASQIAARIGDGITRNAVIGKRIRMGIPDRQTVKRKRNSGLRRKSKPWRHKQAFGMIDKHTPPRLEADGFVPPADDAIPLEQRKTIATLEDGDCRWPVGDPQLADFHFCGAEKVEGLPYCKIHARRAYSPPQTTHRYPGSRRNTPEVRKVDTLDELNAGITAEPVIPKKERMEVENV